jgi:hypothetical protein
LLAAGCKLQLHHAGIAGFTFKQFLMLADINYSTVLQKHDSIRFDDGG